MQIFIMKLNGGMYMKKYRRAELVITEFDAEDIITTSADINDPAANTTPATTTPNTPPDVFYYDPYEGLLT
jgi:hypothetical protein